MHLFLLLAILTNINFTNNSLEKEIDFNACNYTKEYRNINLQLFEDKEYLIKECKAIRMDDQRLRGIDRELMNDVQNILKVSVILEHSIESKGNIELELIQAISPVLTHNPYYFTKYFHKPLFEFIKSNRCEYEEATILLMTLYKDLFGQPYIDNETRFHTQLERNQVMTKRINEAIDQKLMFKDLCSTVDSFLAKKIVFNEGKIIGKWRRLRANEDLIITIREKDNGELYIIRTNFDSAFPSIRELIRTKENKYKYATPYSSRIWEIAQNGSLNFKYTEEDIKVFNYPIYHEK
ncbi:MAG: hypothetical protein QNK55_02575 [Saprospiraceae bacterium]